MVPVCILLLFLWLAAIPPALGDDIAQTDVSGIIEKANQGLTRGMRYGDIKQNTRRNAVPCTSRGCKWPKYGRYVYVPYVISSGYSSAERNIILSSLASIRQSTCIRFIRRSWFSWSYLYFYPGRGCWSYLGRHPGGQAISLQRNGCLYKGIVQHEVLHALGFHHEQVRSDRDRHIRILNENIQPGFESNFRKVRTNNLNTPYDFNSVMHYSNYAFSKNGMPTIVSKRDPNLSFGRATQMSTNDINRVNKLYRCRV